MYGKCTRQAGIFEVVVKSKTASRTQVLYSAEDLSTRSARLFLKKSGSALKLPVHPLLHRRLVLPLQERREERQKNRSPRGGCCVVIQLAYYSALLCFGEHPSCTAQRSRTRRDGEGDFTSRSTDIEQYSGGTEIDRLNLPQSTRPVNIILNEHCKCHHRHETKCPKYRNII